MHLHKTCSYGLKQINWSQRDSWIGLTHTLHARYPGSIPNTVYAPEQCWAGSTAVSPYATPVMTQKQKSEQNINSLSLPEKNQFQLKIVLIGSADIRIIYNSTPKEWTLTNEKVTSEHSWGDKEFFMSYFIHCVSKSQAQCWMLRIQ